MNASYSADDFPDRPCPRCGSETTVDVDAGLGRDTDRVIRNCADPECIWCVEITT